MRTGSALTKIANYRRPNRPRSNAASGGVSTVPATVTPAHRGAPCPGIRTDRSCLEIRTEEQCPEIETMLQCPEMETSASSSGPHGSYKIYTPQSLGTAIRHYRKEAGLTQADLADQAGLNRTYLSNLESGKETEMLRRILRVLRQLGVGMTLEKEDSSAR